MDFKQHIGKRITHARKNLGITIKELAMRTRELSPARISNWEQGTRSPGPLEAKTLANVLNVSASYLLCLSEDPRGEMALQADLLPRYVPIIPLSETQLSKKTRQKRIKDANSLSNNVEKIALDTNNKNKLGKNSFATYVEDNSMTPVFEINDLIIADPDQPPQPGQYVIAQTKTNNNVIRKYKETDKRKKGAFELVSSNPDWANTLIENDKQGHIIATIIEFRRCLNQ